MTLYQLRTGESLHFGAGNEHAQVTLIESGEGPQALLQILGTRRSRETIRFPAAPAMPHAAPLRDESREVSDGHIYLAKWYQLERLSRSSKTQCLECLGTPGDDLGGFAISIRYQDEKSLTFDVHADPWIPISTELVFRGRMQAILRGETESADTIKTSAWLRRHPFPGLLSDAPPVSEFQKALLRDE